MTLQLGHHCVKLRSLPFLDYQKLRVEPNVWWGEKGQVHWNDKVVKDTGRSNAKQVTKSGLIGSPPVIEICGSFHLER